MKVVNSDQLVGASGVLDRPEVIINDTIADRRGMSRAKAKFGTNTNSAVGTIGFDESADGGLTWEDVRGRVYVTSSDMPTDVSGTNKGTKPAVTWLVGPIGKGNRVRAKVLDFASAGGGSFTIKEISLEPAGSV